MQSNKTLPYILPLISVIALIFVFSRPDITGMLVSPAGGEVNAQIRVITSPDQAIPAGSKISVHIMGTDANSGRDIERSASMTIEEFILLSGNEAERGDGIEPSVQHSGPGYAGSSNYTVPLSVFDIERGLPPGRYVIRTEVSHVGDVISSIEKDIVVS